MTRVTPYLLSLPAVVLVGGVLAGPARYLARDAGDFAALADPDMVRMLGVTVGTAAAVAAVSVGGGFIIALLIDSLTTTRRLALGLVLAPKLAGPLAVLLGLRYLFALADALPVNRTFAGVVLAESTLVIPAVVLILAARLGRIDPLLTPAARGLGATRLGAFRRVTWPLVRPAVGLAGLLAFVWGLGAVLGPQLFGHPTHATLGVEIHRQAFDYSRPARAAAAAVELLAVAALPLVAWAWLARRGDS